MAIKRRKLKGGARAWTKRIDPPFHRFIRLRDTNEAGYGKCISCDKAIHFHEGDAGHFQSRQHKATRWNEENVNLQCKSCNMWEGGNAYEYGKALGTEKAEELAQLARTTYKLSDPEWEDIYYHYKELVEELEKTKTFL
jgi:hypothetical protein